MSHTVRIGTFNIGSGYGDYTTMLQNFPAEFQQLGTEYTRLRTHENGAHTVESLQIRDTTRTVAKVVEDTIMARIEPIIAKRLAARCDVICLQEITTTNRPFIQTLVEQGFEFFFCGDPQNLSTAVALRKSVFDGRNISILSQSSSIGTPDITKPIPGQEIGGVVATIKGTNLNIAISSLHCWGLPLHPPGTDPKTIEKGYTNWDKNTSKPRALKYTQEAMANLRGNPAAFTIMAGDMNNNPHNHAQQFDEIQKAGYQIFEPNEATDINSADTTGEPPIPTYLYRKLDFFFPLLPKSRMISRLWSDFLSLFVCKAPIFRVSEARVMKEVRYSYNDNCSDHRPVVVDLTIQTQSTIAWLWSCVMKRI